LRENGDVLRNLNSGLLKKFEETIKLAKKIMIREREQAHRIENGIIAEIRDLKADMRKISEG
jgi:hypothetical protein